MLKKTILIDLDGVLNTYRGEYTEKQVYPLADGASNFVKEISKKFRVVIFTSGNLLSASKWVIDNKLEEYIANVTNIKEPSFLIIDDRCINFNGSFEELNEKINNFKVWYKE